MKVYAPVKDTNGVYASVRFVNGVGETDNPHLIEWFKNQGYELEKSIGQRVEQAATAHDGDVGTANQPDEPDFDSMTPNELREWMKENGYGLKMKNIRSKDKLIEIIRG